ncbi:MAG: DUF4097 domain-containing protein [bacterium]|nr:DUF4097 domain-containing protein [bacterium]
MRTTRKELRGSPGRKCLTAILAAGLLLAAVAVHADDDDAVYFVREVTGEARGPFELGNVVRVESAGGSIEITAWDRDSMDVKATLEAINIDDRNRELFEREARVEIRTQADGYSVEVHVPEGLAIETRDLPNMLRGCITELGGGKWRYTPSVEVTLEIKVPRKAALDLRTEYGDVIAGGVEGEVIVTNSSGAVELDDIGGPAFVENSYGEVRITGCRRSVKVANNSGSVVVEDAEAKVEVRSSYEPVTIRQARGPVTVVNESGAVTVTDVEAGGLQATGSYEDMVIERVTGPIRIRCSSAEVKVAEIEGDVLIAGGYEPIEARGIRGDLTVESESCDVTAVDVTGDLAIRASYEDVNVSQIGGRCSIQAESAEVDLADVGGDVRVRTSYEQITAKRVGGSLNIEGESCAVVVEGVKGDLSVENSYEYVVVSGTEASIVIEGDSSPVEITNIVDLPTDAVIDVRTSYNRVELVLPAEVSATVEAVTSDGDIESEFPMTYTRNGHRRAEAVIGGGATRIVLETSEDIVIKKVD